MSYKSGNRAGGGKFGGGKKFGGKKGGFGGGFGGGKSFGGRDTELHKTNCSECQKPCEVPFIPNGKKPVYCRSCFKNHDGESAPRETRSNTREGSRRDFGGRSFDRAAPSMQESTSMRFGSNSMTSDQFNILNTKLDEILDALDAISHTR